MVTTKKNSVISSAERVLGVLEYIANSHSHLTVKKVAEQCKMSRPTAYRYLMTLQNYGYINQNLDGSFTLGSKLLYLGNKYLENFDWLKTAIEKMRELSHISNETIHMGALDNTDVTYIAKVEGPQSIRMFSRIGSRNPIYSTAMGKALLAFSDDLLRQAIIERIDLQPKTENTIINKDQLLDEITAIRQNGYAIDNIENEEGVRCIGTVIRDGYGKVICALSISAPAFRLDLESLKKLAPPLLNTAEEISLICGPLENHNLIPTSLIDEMEKE